MASDTGGETLSIKEFAARVGKSTQAIYQRIDKDLKPYLQVIDKQKRLDIKALSLFVDKNIEQDTLQEINKQLVSTLQEQLKIKDAQITALSEELSKEREHSRELSRNNQILLGIEKVQANPTFTITAERPADGEQPEQPEQVKKKSSFWDRFKKKGD